MNFSTSTCWTLVISICYSSLIFSQNLFQTEVYYPISDKNEWRYTAPEGWKGGDYVSLLQEEPNNFEDLFSINRKRYEEHKKYFGEKYNGVRSFRHFDATKSAKLLQVIEGDIFYIGEYLSGDGSTVIFEQPILWFESSIHIGQELNEERRFTKFGSDDSITHGTFSIQQKVAKLERTATSSGIYYDCLRIEFSTYWDFGKGREAKSINTYHHAPNIGVVKASARFIILQDEKIIINRLVQTDLKSYSAISNNQPYPSTAEHIMKRAHEHAGGTFWSRPKSLSLKGYGYFYKNGVRSTHERHEMYRVFEDAKEEAHAANGKVRIESYKNGQPIILITFNGEHTYDLNGQREKSKADEQWSSNFGYGVIRHALDPGYSLERLPDDTVDGEDAYFINVIDPRGGKTIFSIAKRDYKIIKVAFDTPRGWHERIYSNFFTKEEYNWQQSGLVRLYYNGTKSNEIIWEDFDVNKTLPDSLFTL